LRASDHLAQGDHKRAQALSGADIGARLIGIAAFERGAPADLKQELGHLLRVETSRWSWSHVTPNSIIGPPHVRPDARKGYLAHPAGVPLPCYPCADPRTVRGKNEPGEAKWTGSRLTAAPRQDGGASPQRSALTCIPLSKPKIALSPLLARRCRIATTS